MGNFAPDGKTYYLGQNFQGIGGFVYIVDLSDPSNPQAAPSLAIPGRWQAPRSMASMRTGRGCTRGKPGMFGDVGTFLGARAGRAGDRGRQRLSVPSPQSADPDHQHALLGRPRGSRADVPIQHQRATSTSSARTSPAARGAGGAPAACARGASPFGYPHIIDVTDETNPKIVSKLRLEVSDPANCAFDSQ